MSFKGGQDVAAVLVTAVLLTGCVGSADIARPAASAPSPEVWLPVDAAPGYSVLEVARADNIIYFGGFNLTVGYGPYPWMIAFVHPNGTVDVVAHWGFSNAHYGQGTGIAYASAEGTGAETPVVDDPSLPLIGDWQWHTRATRGHFIVMWTGFQAPGKFNFTFAPGTHVREVASGSVEWFDLRGFEKGVAAGLAPAAGVGRGLASDMVPANGYQKLGLVSTYSDQAVGGARVTLENGTIDLPFSGVCVTACGPLHLRSALFTTDAPATVHVDWAGVHRGTRVVVTHLDVPLGILPDVAHVFAPRT